MPNWPKSQREDAIAWYAREHGVRVFTDVPVTRPDWAGWPEGTNERLEAIAVGTDGSPGDVCAFDEVAFRAAVSTGHPIRPLIARSYADRTVFGWLLTRRAFTARSWRPRGAVLPVALVAPGSEDSNVAPAYFANGFEIVPVGRSNRPLGGKRSGGGGVSKGRNPWDAPKRGEDELLHKLFERRGRAGWWLAEVPVGFGTSHYDAASRRFDAVVVSSEVARHSVGGADLEEFGRAVASGASVELIEAKNHLSADAIGQLMSGAYMFSDSWPQHGSLTYTLCVRHQTEFALLWFCASQGIKIEQIDNGAPGT